MGWRFVRSRSVSRLLHWVILLIVLVTLPPATEHTGYEHVHPALTALAAQSPTAMVEVIIQKSAQVHAGQSAVESAVIAAGGAITRDLRIINAVVARLSAVDAVAIAQMQGVRWVSLNAPVLEAGKFRQNEPNEQGAATAHHLFLPIITAADTSVDSATEPSALQNLRSANGSGPLLNAYIPTIRADRVWQRGIRGDGVTVAVVDSGITGWDDFKDIVGNLRIRQWVQYSHSTAYHPDDYYGHGSHVAGVIGGNGKLSGGAFIGVAPNVNLINVKVTNDQGAGFTADVVAGLQWILEHKAEYNIRVVNLSLNSSVPESYHVSPLAAAVEILWFNGIVVVVSAGNNGNGPNNGILYPPANDPFVITVGAMDDRGTPAITDDRLATFSAYGMTPQGHAKPDLMAPGANIVSLMGKPNALLAQGHPAHRVDDPVQSDYFYFRMSGTSTAAPMVAGAVALLLQDEPNLTPDQVKYRLMTTARPLAGKPLFSTGAGYLDIYAAVQASTTAKANTNLQASQLLWGGTAPVTWSSVSWNTVSWNTVSWNTVSWNSDYWE